MISVVCSGPYVSYTECADVFMFAKPVVFHNICTLIPCPFISLAKDEMTKAAKLARTHYVVQ